MSDALGKFALAIGCCLIFGALERAFPAQAGQTFSGRARNIALTAVALGLGGLVIGGVYWFVPACHHSARRSLFSALAAALASAVLTDFAFYWYHRAEHRLQFLWAIHELHHSDEELNATTSMRTFWLEPPLQALLVGIPVGYCVGLDSTAAAASTVVLTVWFFLSHANLRLHLGVLTPVLCGPQLHRIHHSKLPHHRDKNFAQFFPFIDILFGTYHRPSRDEFPPTGTPDLRSDASLATMMARPFGLWAASLRALVRR